MYFWLLVIIILTILEVATINLASIWFIASAIVSLIISFVFDNFLIEMAVFVILGLILLITTRPIFNKLLKSSNEKFNSDRVIGMNGVVTEKIDSNTIGEVKVDGKRWSAISDENLLEGQSVKVISIDGVKLKVKKD